MIVVRSSNVNVDGAVSSSHLVFRNGHVGFENVPLCFLACKGIGLLSFLPERRIKLRFQFTFISHQKLNVCKVSFDPTCALLCIPVILDEFLLGQVKESESIQSRA